MNQRLSKWVGLLLISGLAGSAKLVLGAELFVGSSGGDYTDLATAVAAASAGDTITVRGGYSTLGAIINKPLTIRAELNWNKHGYDPSDMTALNPARGAESTITSPLQLKYSPSSSGTKILGVFFDIPASYASGGSVIHFPDSGSGRVTDIIVRNCRLKCLSTSINGFMGTGGGFNSYANRVLIENNRFGTLMLNNATILFVIGFDWTIKNNYVNHNADGGRTTENGRRGFNIAGTAALPTTNIVVTGNLFKDLGGVTGNSWALQPNGYAGNIVFAYNKFDGCARDMAFYPAGTNFLVAGNMSTNNSYGSGGGGFSIDLLPGGNLFAKGLNAMTNLVVRHNLCDVDMAGDKAFRWAVIRPFSNNTDVGSILIERNEVTIRGTAGANTSARGAIRFGSGLYQDRFDLVGPITIRNNSMNAVGYSGGPTNIPSVGLFFPATSSGRSTGGMDLTVANNQIRGFDSGVYVDLAYTGTNQGALPAGDTARFYNNNILTNGLGVNGGTGAVVSIDGSYFSGNLLDISNSVAGTPASSPNPVAGRDPNYVTFRGDFNLDNAVNSSDYLVWSNNFGLSGPAATYYKGDATLDQMVSATDLLVWKRYNGLDINATAPAAQPTAPAGYPVVKYIPKSGILTIAGNGSAAWGFEITLVSNTASVNAHSEGYLGAGWAFAAFTNWPATNRIEFVDVSAGGSPAPVAAVQVAQFPANLSILSFGTVKYYVGSNVFETAVVLNDPFPTFMKPIVVGSHAGLSLDWVQASPFANKDQIYFHISGGDPFPAYTSTLKPDGKYPTGYSQSSVNIRSLVVNNFCKGSALYNTNVLFMAGEGQNNGYAGYIYRIDPATGSGVIAVNFGSAGISRTDTATTYWGGPNAVAVDRVNNKLYVSNQYDGSYLNEGTSVARFSIDPGTYALTLDFVATVYPYAAGAGRTDSFRQLVLPDGYVMVLALNYNTSTAYVAGFNGMAADRAALEASVTTEAAFAFDTAVRGLVFRADAGAPSGIGYVYTVGYGNSTYNGVIKAYDYKGSGKLGSMIAAFDADAALATAGLWTSGNRPRIAALDWTQDGALIVSTRGGNGGTSPGNAAGFVFTFRSPRPGTLILVK